MRGATSGIRTTTGIESSCPWWARARAWFPADAAITPCLFCSWDRKQDRGSEVGACEGVSVCVWTLPLPVVPVCSGHLSLWNCKQNTATANADFVELRDGLLSVELVSYIPSCRKQEFLLEEYVHPQHLWQGLRFLCEKNDSAKQSVVYSNVCASYVPLGASLWLPCGSERTRQ